MILIPVFAGRTSDGELIVLYKEEDDLPTPWIFTNDQDRQVKHPEQFHLRRPDGELWALEPGAKLNYWKEVDLNYSHIKIQSSAWIGEAQGSRLDLMSAKILDRN